MHSCGHPASETTSWAADELNPERTIRYSAEAPKACQACRTLHRKQKEFQDAGTMKPDLLWSVTKQQTPTT
jgi:hypothetical protein